MKVFSVFVQPGRMGVVRPAWVLCAVLAAGGAWAEPKGQDAALQQVLRKAQGVVRQLGQEKAALEAEKAAWLGEKAGLEEKLKRLEDAVRKLEPLQGEVERYKAGLESLQSAKAGLESQLGQSRERERQLQKKHRDIATRARDIQSDNQWLVEAVKERERWIEQCGRNNRELQGVNRELLEKYRDKGFWERVGDLEPFTGIGKARTETALEDYRYRLEHLKATPFQGEARPAPEAGPAGGSAPDAEEAGEGDEP